MSLVSSLPPSRLTTIGQPSPDPETYDWDLLDADLIRRLDLRKYVSLSRERRLHIPIEPLAVEPPKPHRGHTSIFHAGTPGALTLEEVEHEIALGEWKLQIRGANVQLQVHVLSILYCNSQTC